MKTFIISILVLSTLSAPAAAQTTDAELQQLVARVQRAVASPGTAADKDAAAQALRRAIAELERQPATARAPAGRRGRGTSDRDACIELGVRAYSQTQYETTAFENARKTCSPNVDVRVVAIAFEIYRATSYDATAFEKAVVLGRRPDLFGKASLLRFATEKYAETRYPQSALELAAELVATIDRHQDGCVRRAFDVYSENNYAKTALEKAVQICREE